MWLVEPHRRTVTVYRQDGTVTVLYEADVLDGEDVPPGLRLPVAAIFAYTVSEADRPRGTAHEHPSSGTHDHSGDALAPADAQCFQGEPGATPKQLKAA